MTIFCVKIIWLFIWIGLTLQINEKMKLLEIDKNSRENPDQQFIKRSEAILVSEIHWDVKICWMSHLEEIPKERLKQVNSIIFENYSLGNIVRKCISFPDFYICAPVHS